MSDRQDFLFELGTEELPPSSLHILAESLFTEVTSGLTDAGLDFTDAQYFATPRRLAVLVIGLITQQAPQFAERRGPSVQAAFNAQGEATQAALGFAAACGCTVDELSRNASSKGEYLVYSETKAGQATPTLLPPILTQALQRLPIEKRMRWGTHRFEFVRPVAWLVCLWGGEVLPFSVYGFQSQRHTRGHRVHAPTPLPIATAQEYPNLLRTQGYVEPSLAVRQQLIEDQIATLAQQQGFNVVVEADLLREVTALTEWPVVMHGSFDIQFLEVPPEALISSMQGHQKYFPVRNTQGQLLNQFVFVANLESTQPNVVVQGNETVIRPRLADAMFFWQHDCLIPLAQRVQQLDDVVFHEKLGSLGHKTQRLVSLSTHLAEEIQADVTATSRGALLAKADLVSDLVIEFTELQGIAGSYYAKVSGETQAVAQIIQDHYLPRFAGDTLPLSPEGTLVAIADRIDTLVGIFAIGEKPTGTRDPYALRRASVGLLRLIIEHELPFDLRQLLNKALLAYQDQPVTHRETAVEQTLQYVLDRLRAWYLDQGYDVDVFLAVRALQETQPLTLHRRLVALQDFKRLHPQITADLAEANKRVANILSKSGYIDLQELSLDGLIEPQEVTLRDCVQKLRHQVSTAVHHHQFTQALDALATLKEPLADFFMHIMVMTDDEELRQQRLALLSQTRNLFIQVVDISLVQFNAEPSS